MAIDGFLELIAHDGSKINGESLDHYFQGAIAIDNFEMKGDEADGGGEQKKEGKDSSAKQSGKTKGKLKHPISFKISKPVDSSSPALYLSYCEHSDEENENDEPFQLARVTLRKSDSSRALSYMVLEFANAFVTSYSLKTDSDKLPTETIRFTCTKCCVTYRAQRVAGGGRATFGGWDFVGGTAWESGST